MISARARERLERADRLAAIGTLAAGIVHDIRNPLVSVRTFLQLLPERLDDEEFRTTFRELALAELDRVCTLINDLLSFSRPAPPQRETTDLGTLVEDTVRLLDAEARKGDVRLQCGTQHALVLADEGQLRQVLMNVVLNAIEATPPLGTVEVTCRVVDEDTCQLTVTDTGPGPRADDAEHLFEPFYTTKDYGSGLGLYVARRIVGEHGGTIDLVPHDGGGCRVEIRLPTSEGTVDVAG